MQFSFRRMTDAAVTVNSRTGNGGNVSVSFSHVYTKAKKHDIDTYIHTYLCGNRIRPTGFLASGARRRDRAAKWRRLCYAMWRGVGDRSVPTRRVHVDGGERPRHQDRIARVRYRAFLCASSCAPHSLCGHQSPPNQILPRSPVNCCRHSHRYLSWNPQETLLISSIWTISFILTNIDKISNTCETNKFCLCSLMHKFQLGLY